MHFVFFSTLSHKREHRASCKVSVIYVNCSRTRILWTGFSNNLQISNFMKIRLVEAELFHAVRET